MAVGLGKAATDCMTLNLKSSRQPTGCYYAAVTHNDGSLASPRPLPPLAPSNSYGRYGLVTGH